MARSESFACRLIRRLDNSPSRSYHPRLYTLPALKLGGYRVTAELSGFKRAVADAVEINAQSRVRVDLQLH